MSEQKRILVTGAGGFIGSHLVRRLKKDGHFVRGVDVKNSEFMKKDADEFYELDLRKKANALEAFRFGPWDEVYALAADMGGMGFISKTPATILSNNLQINLHTLEAARHNGVKKYLFASSACVYPEGKQLDADVTPLKEGDAYPAEPDTTYGWEKLITERLVSAYRDQYGLDTRIVRFHNVYGPYGTYDGGREKVPAALCRKLSLVPDDGSIEIWGDGEQTRSFCYIDDCVKGILAIMDSDYQKPLNLGRDELVSITRLAEIIRDIAGKPDVTFSYVDGPVGVQGRNSDNSLCDSILGWSPEIGLEEGLTKTYEWIERVQKDRSRIEGIRIPKRE